MAEDGKSTADTVKEAFQDRIVEPAKRAGEKLRVSGEKVAEGSSHMGLKVIDQAEQNAREAFAAMRAAANAKDLAEVIRVQSDYLREQSNRSLTQAREIAEMIVQVGRDAVAPLREDSGD